MTVELMMLLAALALLWFPRRWMRRGWALLRRRRRSAASTRITEPWNNREPGDPRILFTSEFKKLRNYLDLLRAGAASFVLMGGLGVDPAIAAAPGAKDSGAMEVMAVRAVILLIGLLVQAVRYENGRVTFYPPIFYIAGLSLGLSDPRGAAFAFVLIWAVSPSLANAQAFLTVYALLIVGFGHLFAWRGDLSAAYCGILCFLPVLLSLLAKRPLLVFERKSTRPAT